MSGFLQRLAARALGQPGPIHAATPSPLLFSTAEPAVAWTEAMPVVDAMGGEAAPPRPSMPEPPPPHAASRHPASPVLPAAPPPVVADLDRQPEAMPVRRTRDVARARVEPASPVPADAAPRAMRRPPTVIPEAESEAVPGIHPEAPTAVAGEAGRVPARPASPDPMPAVAPAPLLPLEPPSPLRPRPAQPAAALPGQPRRPSIAVEETTEVHVSIGRIEITAVHEAPPPTRAVPKAGNKPMSLDEYLARRQGRTP